MPYLNPNIFTNFQFIIFEIISTTFMIIASILLISQGFDNDKFKNYKSREIKTERLLFSQFSYEVYSNILSFPFYPWSGYDYLTAEFKFNPSFDCRGIKDDELNEVVCQDQIINNNWTCCKAECCFRTNGGNVYCNEYNFNLQNPNIYNHRILTYDEEEYFEDPRRRFCTYYNKYYKDINRFMGNSINIDYLSFNYEDLLLKKEFSNFCISIFNCSSYPIDCGIIDTLDRHLYSSSTSCPVSNIYDVGGSISLSTYDSSTYNYNKIKIRNIISEIPPIPHEYKKKICQDTDLINEEITIKDMNKLLKNSKNNYEKMESIEIPLSSIRTDNYISIENKMNNNSKFYWYTTNYIGFETVKDFKTFEDNFNKSDDTDNNLYKIGEKIYPCISAIIVMFPLLAIFLCYIIILLLILFNKISFIEKRRIVLFIIRISILFLMISLESIFYGLVTNEFKAIKISMDQNYEEILDLYNKRRLQLKFLLSIIFLILSFILTFIFLLINCKLSNENIENDADFLDNNRNEIEFPNNNHGSRNLNIINYNFNGNQQESDRQGLSHNRIQSNNNIINSLLNSENIRVENNNKFNNDVNENNINNELISENKKEDIKEEEIIKKSHNDISKEINLNYIQNINKEIIHNKKNQNKEIHFEENQFNTIKQSEGETLSIKENQENFQKHLPVHINNKLQFSKPNVEIKDNEMFNNLKPEQMNEDKKSNKDPDISKIKNDIFPYGGFDLISSDKSENSKKPKND